MYIGNKLYYNIMHEGNKFIVCPYCSKIVKYNDPHIEICISNYIDNKLLWCYSCGEKNKKYSSNQLAKKEKARCYDCIINKNTNKYQPYRHLYELCEDSAQRHNESKLMDAVSQLNLGLINKLLLLNVNVIFFCIINRCTKLNQ
jgi:hypothetical protein